MPPNAVYTDADTVHWLGTPAATEALFVKKGFPNIPDNYLSVFEEWLYGNSFLTKLEDRGRMNGRTYTHVVCCEATLCRRRQFIQIDAIITRPCAEHLGLYHLIILQIVRYCHLYNLDLIIHSPTTTTVEYLLTVLPREIVFERVDVNNRVVSVFIPVRFMGKLAGQMRGLMAGKGHLDGIQDDSEDLAPVPPRLHLFPTQFPTAHQLCHGPLAARYN